MEKPCQLFVIRRETKIVEKANTHIQRTAQRLLDEATVTLAKQMLLEESIVETERGAGRMLEIRTTNAVQGIVGKARLNPFKMWLRLNTGCDDRTSNQQDRKSKRLNYSH